MERKCWRSGEGKCSGSVKPRPVLRYDGKVSNVNNAAGPECERHYRRDLQDAVKRGATAAALLEQLDK
jgi:hypothetical protein